MMDPMYCGGPLDGLTFERVPALRIVVPFAKGHYEYHPELNAAVWVESS